MNQTPPTLSSRRELLLTVAGTILVMALAINFFAFLQNSKNAPIPSSVRSKVSYTPYLASSFPSGFQPTSKGYVNLPGKVIQLTLQNSAHDTIIIAQLAAPSGYNPLKGNNPLVVSTTPSSLGTIYNLSLKTSYRYAIDTGQTMIMISSTSTAVTPAMAKQIFDGLKKDQ